MGTLLCPRGHCPSRHSSNQLTRRTYRAGGGVSDEQIAAAEKDLHWARFGGFMDDFDIALSSHQPGAIKPDADAVVPAFDACGCEPCAVYFFDDQFSNVQTAQTLGAKAFHVEGVDARVQ